MNITSQLIKNANFRISNQLAGSNRYWKLSPAGISLRKTLGCEIKSYFVNKKVLDAGAGRLAYKQLIKEVASEYTSLDYTKTVTDLDLIADIQNIPVKSKSFEAVFCSQVLEHVPFPWLAFAEIYRVLKKDGVLVLSVPMLGYIHNAPHDYYRYTEYGINSLASNAGFKSIRIYPIGGLFAFLGYIRSTFIRPIFVLPIVGDVLLYINYFFSNLELAADKIFKTEVYFPLNYVAVLKK